MSKPSLHVPVGDLCRSLVMSTHNELCIPGANRLLAPVLAVAMPIMSTHNELCIPKANRLLAPVLAVIMSTQNELCMRNSNRLAVALPSLTLFEYEKDPHQGNL